MQSVESGKKQMHVCHIVRHAQIAGTEKHVMLLATRLDKTNFTAHVCAFEFGDLVDRLKAECIQTTVIPGSHSILHFVKLVLFLKKHSFDIIHCHSGGYACVAAKLAGCKRIIYTKHGIGFTREELQRRTIVRKWRDHLVDKCVDKYIAVTKHDGTILARVLQIDRSKIVVIYNGVEQLVLDAEPLVEQRGPVIGVVGRLTRQKGIAYLIKAVPAIIRRFGTLRVLIVGSGEEEMPLRRLAENLGVSQNIEFLGYRKDAAHVISRMDVFVLPSVWEGFPYVLLEAMILKKPIIATDIFGINEIVEHGRTGLLVDPSNPKSIAAAVLALLLDKEKARTLGIAAHRRVLERFTVDRTVSQIEQLYISLL